jgi:AcrR family transcriptional regulator
MPSVVRKLARRVKRRLKVARQEGRTWHFYDSAFRLLARQDYELISVAEFAREAGTSVGAFYGRFQDKEMFLYKVISTAFRSLSDYAESDLDPAHWRRASPARIIEGIVRHIVERMSRERAAGAVRAALKLATVQRHALEPFVNYRNAVAESAVALLASRLPIHNPSGSVRNAVQAVFGIVTDATVVGAGPMRLGSERMISALSALMTACLDLEDEDRLGDEEDKEKEERPRRPPKGDKAKGKADGMMEIWDPDLRMKVRAVELSKPRGKRAKPEAKPVPLVDPRTVKQPAKTEGDERPRKRIRLI